MSTLRKCDRIMVLEAGGVAAFDTPAHLERVDGYFRSAMELAGVGAPPNGSSPRHGRRASNSPTTG
jgi:hypothetical protein